MDVYRKTVSVRVFGVFGEVSGPYTGGMWGVG